MTDQILCETEKIFNNLEKLKLEDKVDLINEIKKQLHEHSPFKNEPVDCVLWVPNKEVRANDYNPNTVAPPEMELLKVSILEDGYTQPIVTWETDGFFEVIDGFHRNRVGKENAEINDRIHSYLPVTIINDSRIERGDRIASTIRHNRARGKHQVDSMSEIIIELKNRNWTNSRISKELGMDEDEILRLCQITGLAELFKDEDFSKAWNIEDSEIDNEDFTDEVTELERQENKFRTINTDDPNRIFHTFDKWECYKAGFYNTTKDGMTSEECELEFANFLSDLKSFEKTLKKIIVEWEYSCEHYLTNKSMNRIAYLGQAAVCYAKQIPSKFRDGFYLMTEQQQKAADELALKYLNIWLIKNGFDEITMDEAVGGIERQVEIY